MSARSGSIASTATGPPVSSCSRRRRSRTLVGAAGQPAGAAPCWLPPVVGTIADPFREPPCPWCAGNRGLEYRIGRRRCRRCRREWTGRVRRHGRRRPLRRGPGLPTAGATPTDSSLRPRSSSATSCSRQRRSDGASDTFFFGLRIGDEYADPAPFIGATSTPTAAGSDRRNRRPPTGTAGPSCGRPQFERVVEPADRFSTVPRTTGASARCGAAESSRRGPKRATASCRLDDDEQGERPAEQSATSPWSATAVADPRR